MTTIKRGALPPAPTLPQETLEVAGLGGVVIVRGLLLSQQLALHAKLARATAAADGETEEQAGFTARAMRVAETLAMCVFLDDGEPVYSAAEWDIFGAKHADDAMALYNLARRLNGDDEEASAKN